MLPNCLCYPWYTFWFGYCRNTLWTCWVRGGSAGKLCLWNQCNEHLSVVLQSAQPRSSFPNTAERNIKFLNAQLAGLYCTQLDSKVKMKSMDFHFGCISILLSFPSLSFICVVLGFPWNKDVNYMTENSSAKAQVGCTQTKQVYFLLFPLYLST